MSQRDRVEPIHVHIQRVVDVGLAGRVLNMALNGESVKPQRVKVALAIYNKTVPAMAALAIELRVKEAQSQHDLAAEALAVGIDPSQLFDMPEKKVIEHDSSGKPPTPEIDE